MYTIGIDVGATFIKIGLVDANGRIKERSIVPTPSHVPHLELILILSSAIKKIIKKTRLKPKDIRGVGIGAPGPVDSDSGIVHYLPNIKGWEDVALKSLLEKKLGMRVELDNDVNAMTLAEHKFGAGKGTKNIVCVTLGTGVGGGIVIEGKIYRGGSMAAGEIGHMPLNEIGPLCNCGGRACLERYIGNKYILDRARIALGRDITLEKVSKLAASGNKKALDIWEEVGRKLGIALTQVVNLLNPDKIIIGGGISEAGKFILDPARKTVLTRAMKGHSHHVKIVAAKLGRDAGIIGASLLLSEPSPPTRCKALHRVGGEGELYLI